MQSIKTVSTAAIFSLCAIAMMLSGGARAEDPYQYKVLFSPSESILLAEARGRIMIYDGLANAEVERAMTEQYARIENMMFVRTRLPAVDGGYIAEEDGCD